MLDKYLHCPYVPIVTEVNNALLYVISKKDPVSNQDWKIYNSILDWTEPVTTNL